MKRFIAKRIISVIPVLIIVSIVIFSLIHLVPGDPGNRQCWATWQLKKISRPSGYGWGLDKPLIEQYFIWIGNIFHGDFGMSVVNNETVGSSDHQPHPSDHFSGYLRTGNRSSDRNSVRNDRFQKKRLCGRSCGIRHLPCRNLTPELPAGTFPDVAIFS